MQNVNSISAYKKNLKGFFMENIGYRIKKRRTELGLSQLDIYKKCGIPSGSLSRIENGKTIPSVTVFYKLSKVLNCSMNWLADGETEITYLSSNELSKKEQELIDGFRMLSIEEQGELIDILALKIKKLKGDTKNLDKYSNLGKNRKNDAQTEVS